MKSLKTYIPSVFLAIFLVFSLLGTSALFMANSISQREQFSQIIDSENITAATKTELEKYFEDKYYETGVPASVYTEALSDEYLRSVIDMYIDSAFAVLENEQKFECTIPVNEQLETNIESFFESYAESIDYEKDDNYYKRLDSAIASAYKIIGDYCDVYKLSAINNQGLLNKGARLYGFLPELMLAAVAAVIVFLAILIVINRKSMKSVLYWGGISALAAGILGLIPVLYLTQTRFFDAFVVKQPQIFAAFTSLMYKAADIFTLYQGIITAVGVILIAVYAILCRVKKQA